MYEMQAVKWIYNCIIQCMLEFVIYSSFSLPLSNIYHLSHIIHSFSLAVN